MSNQNKKDRRSGYSNNRRSKVKTDNISFISGPVQYQPRTQSALSNSNFVNTSHNHLHSSSASRRGNAWAANLSSTNGKKLNRSSQSQSISPQRSNKTSIRSPPKQKTLNKNLDYPSLDDANPIKSANSNASSTTNTSPSNEQQRRSQSSWLQYDDDQFESPQQNGKNGTPKNTFSESSQGHQNNNRFRNALRNNAYRSSPRHHNHHQQRAINVDVHSFDRHHSNGGYENNNFNSSHHSHVSSPNCQSQHAAILDGFNGRRRSNKYCVKVKIKTENELNMHWTHKKRFVPNGNITNFTPEFKPYRRPSYNAYLQAIKEREKRDDQTLAQFQHDRKYYQIFHCNEWIKKLQKDQIEKEQHTKLQNVQRQSRQRAPNQSRSNFIYGQRRAMATNQQQQQITTTTTTTNGSPPGIKPYNDHNAATNTPPINISDQHKGPRLSQLNAKSAPWTSTIYHAQSHQHQQQQPQQLPQSMQATDSLSRGTSPNESTNASNQPTKSLTVTPQTNPSLNATIPLPPSISLTDVNGAFLRRGSGQTITPQSISNVNVNGNANTNNTVNVNAVNATIQLQQQQNKLNAALNMNMNTATATTKINLMNFHQPNGVNVATPTNAAVAAATAATATAPIQFSQQLYQQHSAQQQQQNNILQQQRNAMIAAQKQQQQQAMNNIWHQQQNKQPQHVQPQPQTQDFRQRQQHNNWNMNAQQQQQQPGAVPAVQRAFNVDQQNSWQQQRWSNQQHNNHQHHNNNNNNQWNQQQRNQWPPSPHNWNPNGQQYF